MNLAGKRTPGKPFLDIAAGAGDGYAAGCFACPIADEAGNFLITSRNANALYDRDNNNGCRVLMKWQPPTFSEPGLAYLQGIKEVIWEQKLFEGNRITGFLYDLARSQDLGDATPEARAWVAARWQEIARNPYNSASLRSYAFVLLKAALNKESAERTPGEQKLIQSFASYIQQRRTYLAEQGLAMYDAWKANDEAIRAVIRQDASLGALFYYGTVPLDFHGTVGSLMGLGSVGGGVAGALIAANQFIQGIETTTRVIEGVVKVVPTYETSLPHLLSTGLDILRTGQGVAVISGATVITVAGLILTSIALDQSIAIESARPTLEASLTEARKPVNLNMLAKATNGEDMLYYYWAKAMDTSDREDPQVVQLAAQAQAWAQQNGYQAPPKQFVEVTVGPTSVGDAISSATGAASPFTSPGLTQNQKLVSANGIYHALMQGDGNFVIYIYAEDRAIWSTGTHGKGRAPYRLAMQPDGNLVVYGSSDQDVTLSGYGVCRANSACIATWASGPRGGTAPYTLRMQDDGNLVMYDSTQRPVWASGTQR
jgi:hypothetical protein